MANYCLFDSPFKIKVKAKLYHHFRTLSLPVWATTAMGDTIVQVYSITDNGYYEDLLESLACAFDINPTFSLKYVSEAGFLEDLCDNEDLENALAMLGRENSDSLSIVVDPHPPRNRNIASLLDSVLDGHLKSSGASFKRQFSIVIARLKRQGSNLSIQAFESVFQELSEELREIYSEIKQLNPQAEINEIADEVVNLVSRALRESNDLINWSLLRTFRDQLASLLKFKLDELESESEISMQDIPIHRDEVEIEMKQFKLMKEEESTPVSFGTSIPNKETIACDSFLVPAQSAEEFEWSEWSKWDEQWNTPPASQVPTFENALSSPVASNEQRQQSQLLLPPTSSGIQWGIQDGEKFNFKPQLDYKWEEPVVSTCPCHIQVGLLVDVQVPQFEENEKVRMEAYLEEPYKSTSIKNDVLEEALMDSCIPGSWPVENKKQTESMPDTVFFELLDKIETGEMGHGNVHFSPYPAEYVKRKGLPMMDQAIQSQADDDEIVEEKEIMEDNLKDDEIVKGNLEEKEIESFDPLHEEPAPFDIDDLLNSTEGAEDEFVILESADWEFEEL